jgi:hypothetical protein
MIVANSTAVFILEISEPKTRYWALVLDILWRTNSPIVIIPFEMEGERAAWSDRERESSFSFIEVVCIIIN